MAVGDQLHLDVPGSGHQALEEHRAIAEGAQRLVAGALVGVLEIGCRGDHPDPAATTAGGRLQHQRVADALGCGQGAVQGLDGAAAPRSHGHAHLLGDQLRADLVAELAHRIGARADEGDPEAVAQVDERRVLGHEAPARPRGVGAGLDESPFEGREVDVGARGCRAEVVGEVGLAHEGRATLTLGVQRHGLDRPTAGRVDLPHCMDQPHRSLTTVDDRDSIERHEDLRRPTARELPSGSVQNLS